MANPDSTTLPTPIPTSPTPIPTSLNVTALAKREGVTRRTIQRRLKNGWTPPATSPRQTPQPVSQPMSQVSHSMSHPVVTLATLVTAVALAGVSGFFGVVGMTAIFAAAVIPVMIMTGVLEAAKLVTAAWLARHWGAAPLLLRLPLVGMVLALMLLTAVGTFGFPSRAHLEHQVLAAQAVDKDAAPVAQRVALADAAVQDIDGRIVQLDDVVRAATSRAYTRTAMQLVTDQQQSRTALVAQRQAAAERLADLKVQQAGIEAQRARVVGEAGPALYLAKLFGSEDTEATVRLITALLVLVLDPLAVLLTIAGSRKTTM